MRKSRSQLNIHGLRTDISNQKFGRLTALYPFCTLSKPRERKIGWVCKCDCGKEAYVLSQSLRIGITKSCGCYHKEIISKLSPRRLARGESGLNYLISNYKTRAQKHSREYTLSREDFHHLTSSNCHYCGAEPSQIITPAATSSRYTKDGKTHGQYTYNGIDRVDSGSGYTKENCVPCCKFCNRVKLDYSYEEFVNWIKGASEWIARI